MANKYVRTSNEICRRCLGEGIIGNPDGTKKSCDLCNGSGIVVVKKEINVSVEPKQMPYAS